MKRSPHVTTAETIGPPEIRDPVVMFTPLNERKEPLLDVAPTLDERELFLARLFLRRYVTWCARRRRFAQMQGAVKLFAEC